MLPVFRGPRSGIALNQHNDEESQAAYLALLFEQEHPHAIGNTNKNNGTQRCKFKSCSNTCINQAEKHLICLQSSVPSYH